MHIIKNIKLLSNCWSLVISKNNSQTTSLMQVSLKMLTITVGPIIMFGMRHRQLMLATVHLIKHGWRSERNHCTAKTVLERKCTESPNTTAHNLTPQQKRNYCRTEHTALSPPSAFPMPNQRASRARLSQRNKRGNILILRSGLACFGAAEIGAVRCRSK